MDPGRTVAAPTSMAVGRAIARRHRLPLQPLSSRPTSTFVRIIHRVGGTRRARGPRPGPPPSPRPNPRVQVTPSRASRRAWALGRTLAPTALTSLAVGRAIARRRRPPPQPPPGAAAHVALRLRPYSCAVSNPRSRAHGGLARCQWPPRAPVRPANGPEQRPGAAESDVPRRRNPRSDERYRGYVVPGTLVLATAGGSLRSTGAPPPPIFHSVIIQGSIYPTTAWRARPGGAAARPSSRSGSRCAARGAPTTRRLGAATPAASAARAGGAHFGRPPALDVRSRKRSPRPSSARPS